jgi:alpha-ketoglutarate-dependent taurine dioxygenase
MDRAAISINPLTPVIGAEMEGIDLDQPVDDDAFILIHDALIQHHVIFFRHQDTSVEAQMNLGRRFGELVAHPNDPGLPEHPEVITIHADQSSKRVAGENWHSDVSCEQEPPLGSILRIHTLPEARGLELHRRCQSPRVRRNAGGGCTETS